MPSATRVSRTLPNGASSRVRIAPSRPLAFFGSKVIAAQPSSAPTSASATPFAGYPTCPSRSITRRCPAEACAVSISLRKLFVRPLRTW